MRFRTLCLQLLWAGLVLAASALAAAAQTNPAPAAQDSTMPNALQGFARNKNEPVKIDANRLEVHDKDKLAIFSGNVYVQQGDTNMRCPELKVYYEGEVKDASKNSGGTASDTKSAAAPKASTTENNVQQRIRRLEALGGVIVISKDQKATGDRADFDMKLNTVTLFGNVVVSQGPNVMKGDRLIVNLSTSQARMEAGSQGKPGRVQGLFIPSSAKDKDAETKKGNSQKGQTQQTPPQ
ncbi:MAG TPA: LptA/OstA family protein [Xanthobacteraceae bacterium]|nr:LptA/OstA family protein [Xanthobacteraceae bacterium]